MLCSNCGKDIPFNGNVCPYCHADKSGDQMITTLGVIGGAIGGFIGYSVNGVGGAIVGFFVGAIPLMILGFVAKSKTDAKTGGVPTLPNTAATLRKVGLAHLTDSSVRDEVPCRVCAEPILRQAKKCKHCGEIQAPPGSWDTPGRDTVKSEASIESYACQVCHRRYSADDVYDQGGTYICKGCHARQSGSMPPQPVYRYACAQCGGRFTVDSLYDQGGSYICHNCYSRSSVEGSVAASQSRATFALAGQNQLTSKQPPISAFTAVVATLGRIGKVTAQNPSMGLIEGCIRYGLNSVKIRVSVRADGPRCSTVIVESAKGDVWGVAGKAVTEMLMEALTTSRSRSQQ